MAVGLGGSGVTVGLGGSGVAEALGNSGVAVGLGGSGVTVGLGGSAVAVGLGGSAVAVEVGERVGDGTRVGEGARPRGVWVGSAAANELGVATADRGVEAGIAVGIAVGGGESSPHAMAIMDTKTSANIRQPSNRPGVHWDCVLESTG